jgi:hypothetical protein
MMLLGYARGRADWNAKLSLRRRPHGLHRGLTKKLLEWNPAVLLKRPDGPEVRRSGRVRQISEQLHSRWAEWRVHREQRLHALKSALQRSPNPPPSRSCCACGEHWFATKDFFYLTSKRGGTSFSMSQTCRLCRSTNRRDKTLRVSKNTIGPQHSRRIDTPHAQPPSQAACANR